MSGNGSRGIGVRCIGTRGMSGTPGTPGTPGMTGGIGVVPGLVGMPDGDREGIPG